MQGGCILNRRYQKIFALFAAFALLTSVVANGFTVSAELAPQASMSTVDFDDIPSVTWEVLDISKWQPTVTWSGVASSVDAVMLRIGYRGSAASATLNIDPCFVSHYQGAKGQNLPVGCYFYSYAKTTAMAVEEAEWIINQIETNDYQFDMPIYFDIEAEELISLGKTQLTAITKAFCNKLSDAGYFAGVYCNKNWATNYLTMSEFSSYSVWMAQYNSTCTYSGKYEMWQYTDSGTVSGITGGVDLSKCYKDFPSYIKSNGFNGYSGGEEPQVSYLTGFYTVKTTDGSLNVRSEPSSTATIVGTLASGDQVYIYETNNSWGKVSCGEGFGWINLNYAQAVKSSELSFENNIGYHRVATVSSALNVRGTPSASGEWLGSLAKGTVVYVYEESNGWGRISHNGLNGWLSLTYTDFITVVRFNAGTAEGTMDDIVIEEGVQTTLSPASFTNTGYVLSGWATSDGGAVAYEDGATITGGNCNISLYAVWESEHIAPKLIAAEDSSTFIDEKRNYIYGIDEGTTVSKLKSMFINISGEGYIELLSSTRYAGTGSVLNLYDNLSGEIVATYTIIVFGDINGDSRVNMVDVSQAAQALSTGFEEEFCMFAANLSVLRKNDIFNAIDISYLNESISSTQISQAEMAEIYSSTGW